MIEEEWDDGSVRVRALCDHCDSEEYAEDLFDHGYELLCWDCFCNAGDIHN